MRRASPLVVLILPAALAGALRPSPAVGQELAASAGRGESGFAQLDSPITLSLGATYPVLVDVVRLRGGYRLVRHSGRYRGSTCSDYWPAYRDCREEAIETEARLHQWQAGVEVGIPLGDRIELRAAALRVRTRLEASSRGAETGRSAGNHYPEEAVWASALTGGAAWRIRPRIGLLAQLRRETLDLRGCATDTGTPFCGEETLSTLEVGVTFRLPRRSVPR